MNNLRSKLADSRIQGGIALIAAVVMYFTPDEVDHIIEAFLAMLGISKLTIEKK